MGADQQARRPRQPHPAVHRGRRHGARHLARVRARARRGGREGLRRQAQDRLVRGLRRREGVQAVQQLAARRDASRRSASTSSGIKGPLTTPIGGGIRSLNVALRQMLDLYVCLRPVRWFEGVPSPVKRPQDVDMVIFRENTEDIYAGIEFEAESAEAKKILAFIEKEFPKDFKKIRFPATTRHRHQAGEPRGHRAARARGDRATRSSRSGRASPSSTRATS